MHQYLHQGKTVPLRHTRDKLLRARKAAAKFADAVRQLGPEDVDWLEPAFDHVLEEGLVHVPKQPLDKFGEQFFQMLDALLAGIDYALKDIQPNRSAKVSERNKMRLVEFVSNDYRACFGATPSAHWVFADFIERLGKIIKSPLGRRRLVRSILKHGR